jgi:integrase
MLETMFDLAHQYKLTAESPVRSKIHSPTVKRVKKSALKPQQILDVLSEIPDEYKVLHWTIAVTALRIGELLGLQIKDVDLRGGNLHIDHDLWRGQLDPAKTEEGRHRVAPGHR